MLFSCTNYSRLKSRLKAKYSKDLQVAFRDLKKHPKTETAQWVAHYPSDLKEFTSLKWYFLKQIQALLFFLQAQELLPKKSDEFSPLEDMVFEKWNQSEFAGDFLSSLNKGNSLKKASAGTFEIFDEHLYGLAERHLHRDRKVSKSYRLQPSLGDIKRNGKVLKLLETALHIEGKELHLMTNSVRELKDFSHRIEIALKVIRKFSPDSWERFSAFTELIVPINQNEFVSYSHQELPGTSMINLYDRDFVDLMDDLLHENGHHHLNYYLNLGKLIEELPDFVYYSPWRRTLRPIRGIYHAYFTFFWAFKLFSDMASAKELDSIWYLFNEKEKEKIYWRAVEEYWMLDFTYRDLVLAKKQGLINKTGWKLIETQKSELDRFKKKIPLWEKKLKKYRNELKKLKLTLKKNKH